MQLTRWMKLPLVLCPLLAGCFVGWHYRYEGSEYTMTRANSEYHEAAIRDVRSRYGDPHVQTDPEKLKGACELLQKYSTTAPDPGSFTGARELLDQEARHTCTRSQEITRQHEREAESTQQRERLEQDRAAREAKITGQTREQERQRLMASAARDTKTVETCDATADARVARKRHTEILERAPGATVRKDCTPRMEVETVKTECKDANGFARPCTKQVSTGEVAGYACPKTMDPEVVQLGLFELRLLDSYPFPEDRGIRVRDTDCEEAKSRLRNTQQSLGQLEPSPSTKL